MSEAIKRTRVSGIRDAEHAVDIFVEVREKTESIRSRLPDERVRRPKTLTCPKCDSPRWRLGAGGKIVCDGGRRKKCRQVWKSEWASGGASRGPRGRPPAERSMELRLDLALVFSTTYRSRCEPPALGRWEKTVLFLHAELGRSPTPGGRIAALIDAMRVRYPGTRYGTWDGYTVRRLLRGAQKKVEERLRWRGLLA